MSQRQETAGQDAGRSKNRAAGIDDKDTRDLKGKARRLRQGSSAHNLLVAALEKAGYLARHHARGRLRRQAPRRRS